MLPRNKPFLEASLPFQRPWKEALQKIILRGMTSISTTFTSIYSKPTLISVGFDKLQGALQFYKNKKTFCTTQLKISRDIL